jgi:hypothetical protein
LAAKYATRIWYRQAKLVLFNNVEQITHNQKVDTIEVDMPYYIHMCCGIGLLLRATAFSKSFEFQRRPSFYGQNQRTAP